MNERKLKKAFERQTPDVLGAVLAECEQKTDDWQVVKLPEKRRPWVGIACAAAILAFVVSLGAFVWRKPHTEATAEPTQASISETTEPVKTITPIEKNPIEPVTDAYRGSWDGYKYAIPKLNLDSRYAERVNEEIAQSYVLDEDGVLREHGNRSYEYHVEGDILSLVYYLHDNIWVYTLNLSDGSEATCDEILTQEGIAIQDYLTRVTWDLGNTCCSGLPVEEMEAALDIASHEYSPVFNALWETLARSNTDSTQPFFTADGLCFIGNVYDPEDSRRVIFRYDEPVEEAAYYRSIIKRAAFDEAMIATIYDGTSAPGGGRIHKQFIPCVLLGSDYADTVNQEIWSLCSVYMDEDGTIRAGVDISFQSSIFVDMLSLQLIIKYEEEDPVYRAYNFNVNNGNKFEEADVLPLFGLSVEDFNASVMRSLGNFCCSFSGEEMEQYTDTVSPDFAKSVAPENIEAAVPLVLGDELYVIGTVYYSGIERMVYFQYENPAPESPYYQKMLELYRIHLPNQPVTPVDPDNPVVEAYSRTKPYTYEGKELMFSCSVPEIQCDSDYAKAINQELFDYYYNTFDGAGNWYGSNMSYEWHIKGDILSLIVYLFDTEYTTNCETGWPNRVYNIRMSDGSEVTTDEVLQVAGMSKEDFRARVREFLGSYFLYFSWDRTWAEILEDPESHAEDIHLTHFIVTVGEKNLDQTTPYFTEDGELHFTGYVYYPIAGYSVETPMSSRYDNFKTSPYYEEMLKLAETITQ